MRKKLFAFSLFSILTSCFNGQEQLVVQNPSPKKMKQKVASLQKKLELAEKAYIEAKNEVEKIAEEISRTKLALIRQKVEKFEQKKEKDNSLFLEERETLYQIIETGPSPTAFEAQVELDRILRFITEISDKV